MYPVG